MNEEDIDEDEDILVTEYLESLPSSNGENQESPREIKSLVKKGKFADWFKEIVGELEKYHISEKFIKNVLQDYFYQPESNTIFYDYGDKIDKTTLRAFLMDLGTCGLTKKTNDDLGISEQKLCEWYLYNNKRIDYAGPLSGCMKGLHIIDNRRMLATTSPIVITPKSGDFPLINQIINSVVGSGEYGEVQEFTFLGWLKIAYECLANSYPRPGQSIFFAGDVANGKTFLVNKIIKPILGGRTAEPYRYMIGDTPFNADLMNSELLIMDDCVGVADYKARRIFSAHLKGLIYSKMVRFEFKNKDAFSHNPLWRLVVMLNSTEDSLSIIPDIDHDLQDKVIIFECGELKIDLPNITISEQHTVDTAIEHELPFFVNYLINLTIPAQLKRDKTAQRNGIASFHNPNIMAKIHSLAPEDALLEIIDLSLKTNNGFSVCYVNKSTYEIEKYLSDFNGKKISQICPHPNSLGTYLRKLSEKYPDRVIKIAGHKGSKGRSHWSLYPPKDETEPPHTSQNKHALSEFDPDDNPF